jgi:hypothetical protein
VHEQRLVNCTAAGIFAYKAAQPLALQIFAAFSRGLLRGVADAAAVAQRRVAGHDAGVIASSPLNLHPDLAPLSSIAYPLKLFDEVVIGLNRLFNRNVIGLVEANRLQ